MSKLLLLPGNSARHREWILDIQAHLGGEPVIYSHWDTGEEMISFEAELDKMGEMVGQEPCMVFAKSAGVILAMKAVRERNMNIQRAVFLGTPLSWAMDRGLMLDEWLSDWEIPSLFIQNEFDPLASAQELAEHLPPDAELKVVDGDTHEYDVYADYIEEAKMFLNQ